MLIEIKSQAFRIKDKLRPPIPFTPGLNVILGGEDGENSIGKSSALLAIDFVFGGSTYVKSDAVKQVGHHTIFFCFRFKNISYYFARDTKYPDIIYICDNEYMFTDESYTKNEFVNWLKIKYNLDLPELKFRNTVGRFFRIYGKPNCDEKQPLKIRPQENMEDAINTLIKLFDNYKFIEGYKKNLDIQTEEQKAFREARKHNFVPSLVKRKKKYDMNVEKIESLKIAREQLSQDTYDDFSDEQIERENLRRNLKDQAYQLNKKIEQNNSKISLLKINLETGLYPTDADFESLVEYFPDVNLRKLHEVEGFHQKLAIILNDEFTQERELLEAENEKLEESVREVNLQMRELGVSTQLSPEFLDQYSKLTNEIRDLESQNDSYIKLNELNEKKRKAKEALDQNIQNILFEIETQINAKIEEFNDRLFNEKRKAPVLNFKAYNSYSFYTPDDDGTGTNYKGLVLFDLAVLSLSKLPAIAHDSLLFKNIDDESINGIMEIYADSEKQIFIAFDRASSYNPRISSIIYDHTRLELGTDGHELYGEDWKTK